MTWKQYALARQHLAEEEMGKHYRAAHKREKAAFDRSAKALKAAQQRHLGVT